MRSYLIGMVSKKWQKRHAAIEHLVLFGVWGGALFWFELPLPNELKLVLVAGNAALVFILGRHFHRKKATRYEKVFHTDVETALKVTQRMFEAQRFPFRKTPTRDGYRFEVFQKGVAVILETFPLNLPLELNTKRIEATKIVLRNASPDAAARATALCVLLDHAFST